MKLFHFAPEHLLEAIKRDGLTLGVLPVMIKGQEGYIKGFQWLTRNPDFKSQHWATYQRTLPYDRTACRITLVIPKAHRDQLIKWSEIAQPGNYLNQIPGWRDWYIFKGRIPSGWFRKIITKNLSPCGLPTPPLPDGI